MTRRKKYCFFATSQCQVQLFSAFVILIQKLTWEFSYRKVSILLPEIESLYINHADLTLYAQLFKNKLNVKRVST